VNNKEFVDAINGKRFKLTRTCLATGRVEDEETVTPNTPTHLGEWGSSAISTSRVHCYSDTDLFTNDHGVYVAVVKTGAGHLYADRFVPTDEE